MKRYLLYVEYPTDAHLDDRALELKAVQHHIKNMEMFYGQDYDAELHKLMPDDIEYHIGVVELNHADYMRHTRIKLEQNQPRRRVVILEMDDENTIMYRLFDHHYILEPYDA